MTSTRRNRDSVRGWGWAGWCQARRSLAAALAAGLAVLVPRAATASSFAGRLSVGPSYMRTDSTNDYGDSDGLAIAAQLDAGVQLWPALVVHATVIYDYSRWLDLQGYRAGPGYTGSMAGFGVGATGRFAGISLGAVVGGQFTFFPQNDDAASGPNGAGLGPLISLSGGYVWTIEGALNAGVHVLYRYRSGKDETNSIVYDPSGYQLGLVMSLGLDGEPVHGG